MIVKVDVEFNDDGTATIRLPEGKTMKLDQAKVAEFTEKLAKGMGTIVERHKGHSHGYITDATKDTLHLGD
jgi:hypothetical protein